MIIKKKEGLNEKEMPHINERTYIYDQNNTKSFFPIKTIILLILISGFLFYFSFPTREIFLFYFSISTRESFGSFIPTHILYDEMKAIIWVLFGVLFLLIIAFILFIYSVIYQSFSCIKKCFVFFYQLITKYKQRRDFKKICKIIFENIKETIKNKLDKCMSEIEIIEIFSRQYYIEKDIFIKDYMHELNKLRKKDPSFKLFKDWNNEGKKEIFWELND